MNDKTIMKICLVMVVIGIIGLFIVTNFSAQDMKISDIDEERTGQIVTITGNIDAEYTSSGHVFMQINDTTGVMKVVMFEKEAKNYPWVYEIKKGDKAVVTGKIQIYEGELEIVASSVKTI